MTYSMFDGQVPPDVERTTDEPEIVDLTFKFMKSQKPTTADIAPLLSVYFRKLVHTGRAPSLPNEFTTSQDFSSAVPVIAALAHRLADCLFELHTLGSFLTNTVLFPRTIALAFGFQNVLFIADHLNAADVTLVPKEPFISTEESELLIEFLALMLTSDTFIAVGGCEERFLHCLGPATTGALDLRAGLTIASVVDVDTSHLPRFEFGVKTADREFRLSMATCGGCSGYLFLWDLVIEDARRFQGAAKCDNELRAHLTALLTELCRLVFPTWKGRILSFDVFDTDEAIPEQP
jgi:hypothetical protein